MELNCIRSCTNVLTYFVDLVFSYRQGVLYWQLEWPSGWWYCDIIITDQHCFFISAVKRTIAGTQRQVILVTRTLTNAGFAKEVSCIKKRKKRKRKKKALSIQLSWHRDLWQFVLFLLSDPMPWPTWVVDVRVAIWVSVHSVIRF